MNAICNESSMPIPRSFEGKGTLGMAIKETSEDEAGYSLLVQKLDANALTCKDWAGAICG